MVRFVARRLLLVVPLALGAATLVFVAMELAPGSPADVLLGDAPVPQEVRERITRAYGLDRSPVERYGAWLHSLLIEGDLGWSHSRSRPVAQLIGAALPATLLLALAALSIHLAAGLLLGGLCALRRGGWLDRTISSTTLVLYSMPTFWLGLMAVLALSYGMELFPAASMRSVGAEEWGFGRRSLDLLWHLFLPASVLGLASCAVTVKLVREGIVRALDEPYVRAARARGTRQLRVVCVHALRNALLPVVNLIGISLPALFSGSLVIEVVFAWPGMGRLTYDAIRAQDPAVVLAATMLAAGLTVAGSLAADLLVAAIDPRVRPDARRAAV